jgi:glycosyltransferase involved in cell wall biosynthesis
MEKMISFIVPHCEEDILTTRRTIKNTMRKASCEYEIVFIHDENKQGKGVALKRGIAKARGEFLVFIDADLQIHPSEIFTFFRLMNLYAADAVIGSKRHPFSRVEYPLLRHIISNTYNLLVRMLFGFDLRDTQCGIKLFSRNAIKQVLSRIGTRGYAIDLELLVALRENKFRVVDAPVCVKKSTGKGSVSFRIILQTLRETLIVWTKKKMGFYAIVIPS